MATIAMFIALGGTSYAAIVITGANIKDGTVQSRDIANGRLGVQSADVKNRSIKGADVALSTLTGSHIATGSIPATDLKQDFTLAATDDFDTVEYGYGAGVTIPAGGRATVNAMCPDDADFMVVGGGLEDSKTDPGNFTMEASYPMASDSGTGWSVVVRNTAASPLESPGVLATCIW